MDGESEMFVMQQFFDCWLDLIEDKLHAAELGSVNAEAQRIRQPLGRILCQRRCQQRREQSRKLLEQHNHDIQAKQEENDRKMIGLASQ